MLAVPLNSIDASSESSELRRLAEIARQAGYGNSPETALKSIREALSLLDTSSEEPLVADLLRWQGSMLRERGQTSAAEPLYRRSLHISRRIEYDAGTAHALNCLGALAQRRGDIAGAANAVTDALLLAERCGDRALI